MRTVLEHDQAKINLEELPNQKRKIVVQPSNSSRKYRRI